MSINERIGISEKYFKMLIDILSSVPSVEEAIVYGSRAKGNFRPFSDIDLTLKGDMLTNSDLYILADRLYISLLPYLFELSIYSHLNNPALIDHIDRRGVTIFKNSQNTTHAK